eukprot:140468-Chlamydomonas_euryale.AAC.2
MPCGKGLQVERTTGLDAARLGTLLCMRALEPCRACAPWNLPCMRALEPCCACAPWNLAVHARLDIDWRLRGNATHQKLQFERTKGKCCMAECLAVHVRPCGAAATPGGQGDAHRTPRHPGTRLPAARDAHVAAGAHPPPARRPLDLRACTRVLVRPRHGKHG